MLMDLQFFWRETDELDGISLLRCFVFSAPGGEDDIWSRSLSVFDGRAV